MDMSEYRLEIKTTFLVIRSIGSQSVAAVKREMDWFLDRAQSTHGKVYMVGFSYYVICLLGAKSADL